MLEVLTGLPNGVEGVKAVGKVSKADYEAVFEPMLDRARSEGRRIRFLYEIGPEFERFTAGAAWEDATMGLRSMRLFDGCALVSDHEWIREMAGLAGFFMPCPVRSFGMGEREEAVTWLGSLPEGPGISHRLLAGKGVIVVEVRHALRAQDFDALAVTADAWIEAHGDLRGLVIHARAFPGWENLGGLLRHLRFVRDHHRTIRRIAVAADSGWTQIVPRLADHFVAAQVKTFPFDALDDAVSWAAS